MEQLKILKLSPDDDRLKTFRHRVLLQDLEADPSIVNAMNKRQQILSAFVDSENAEEIYKFSDAKWDQVRFDEVLALEYQGMIVSIAGNKSYSEGILRLGMHYYTLREFRRKVRSVLWRKGGFIDFSLQMRHDSKFFFISIYAHNKKLKAWVKRLKKGHHFGQMSIENKDITNCLRLFKPIGEARFNGVPQLILLYSPTAKDIPSDFLEMIGATR